MKKILIVSFILNLLLLFMLIYVFSFEKEDVNKDREINVKDLLIVQKKIIEDMKEEEYAKNRI